MIQFENFKHNLSRIQVSNYKSKSAPEVKRLESTKKSFDELIKEANKVRDEKPRKRIIKDSKGYGRVVDYPSEAEVQRMYEEDLELTFKGKYDVDYNQDLYCNAIA